MTDTEFIQLLLDVVKEACERTKGGHDGLLKARGDALLLDSVRLARGLCRVYSMQPNDVDPRLSDRGFLCEQ